MVRPDDLAKFFSDGLPRWIEKHVPDPVTEPQKKPVTPHFENPPQVVAGTIPITARLGVMGVSRMYVFYKEGSTVQPSQAGNIYAALNTGEDMIPIGKHPQVVSKGVAKALWGVNGSLTPGTIFKVFVGLTNDPTYGMYYYVTDDYALEGRIMHPNENLFIQGKFTAVNPDMYAELGIRRPPARSTGLPVRIVEGQ